jgi:hypothetical protein
MLIGRISVNLVVGGDPLGFNITGECSDIVLLSTTAVKGETPSTDDMSAALLDAASVIGDELAEELRSEGADEGADALKDFQQELEE